MIERKKLGTSLTRGELTILAEDIFKGIVFTDRHIQRQEEIPSVFLALIFIDDELRKEFTENPPGLIYEYISDAAPRSVNGMPMFLSFRTLSREDTKILFEEYNKIVEKHKKLDVQIKREKTEARSRERLSELQEMRFEV